MGGGGGVMREIGAMMPSRNWALFYQKKYPNFK
jgi:hypothetical protein